MTTKYIKNYLIFGIVMLFMPGIAFSQDEKADSVAGEPQTVNIGYAKMPSWMVSSSISTIEGADLQKNFVPDLGNTLYGRLAGLSVMQGGNEPGLQAPSLSIRGLNTFGNGKNVLVLVDGYELPFSQILPEEVESVTILKDASATAIYGSKGANGVMLITTKRGTEGPMKVNIGIQHGYNISTRLPEYLGSYDYASLYNEALVNDGKSALYSDADLQAYKNGTDQYFYPDVNWYNQVMRKYAPVSKFNLNFTGGTKIVNYFVMMNLLREEGLIKKTKDLSDYTINSRNNRFNFRSNVDIHLSKRFSAHMTLGGAISDKTNPADNSAEAILNDVGIVPPNAFPVYNPNGSFGGTTLYSNPLGDILQTGMYSSNGRTFQGAFTLTEQLDMIAKGLSVSASVAFNNTFTSVSNKSRTYSRFALSKGGEGETVYTKIGENTSLSGSEGETDQWRSTSFRGYMNYDRELGNNTLKGLLMFNSSNYTLGIGGLPYLDRGLFGRFTFTNSKKYIGEVSFGYNATDNFPQDSRWGFFPAVSAGWIVSGENFLSNNSLFNFLKLRGSYGLVGNDNIGGKRFMFYQDWVGVGNYFFGPSNTSAGSYGEAQIANPDVTWEKQKQLNIGLEATIAGNFDISFDFFKQNRFDILAEPRRQVPSYLGLTLPDLNIGKAENSGFEAMVRFNSNQSKEFKYYVQVDVFYAKNKIVDNAEAVQLFEYLYRSGRPIGQPFLLEATGFFKDQADIDNSPRQIFSEVKPGDIKYKDQNNDNIIDQTDFYPSGYTNMPEITGVLTTGFSYRNFDFDMLFQGVANRSVYLSGFYYEAFQNNGKISEFALGRWTPETASSATYPRLSAENNLNNFQPSTFWQQNGNFIKLRSLELGYTLPSKLQSKMKVDKARVFVNATNLFSLDHLEFSDPENISGYPAMRTVSVGLNFQF